MSRQKNDGKGRLGGRTKGTPNRATADLKTWINAILNGERIRFVQNLKALSPSEHVKAVLSLLQYAVPKQAPINATEIVERERKMFLSLLVSSPDTAISDIADKLLNQMDDEDCTNQE